jgi:hypothetical protein
MTTRPTDYINRSQLAVTVADNWLQFFPTYSVNFTTQGKFKILSQNFYMKANENANQDVTKKDNSATLKSINIDIRKGSVRLKEYIRDEYTVNIDAIYASYGLEIINKNFMFPTDNDRLMQRLGMLLAKLQEPNNPLANRNQGLAYWEDLITRHAAEWTLSKNMKATKSKLSQECRDMHTEVGDKLSKLFRQIAIDNDRDQVASVRRTFGFLNETYK